MHDLAHKNGGKCISTEYINNKTELMFKCSKIEHPTFIIQPYPLTKGRWCPLCLKDDIESFKDYSIIDMKEFAKTKRGLCISEKYSGYSQKLIWRCFKGHEWEDTPWQIIRNKKWCDECNE